MNKYWFKPREFGYGITPTTWEGWAVTVITMFIVVMTSMLAPVLSRGPAGGFTAIVIVALAITAFILISRMKTDGEWRWRSR
jgi:multisubunit Na+/H+ antiporter MnhB subunit